MTVDVVPLHRSLELGLDTCFWLAIIGTDAFAQEDCAARAGAFQLQTDANCDPELGRVVLGLDNMGATGTSTGVVPLVLIPPMTNQMLG